MGRKFWICTFGYGNGCSCKHALDLKENRRGNHAVQNIERLATEFINLLYIIKVEIPKNIFNENYPVNPKTFGERLRKSLMDAQMQLKDVAGLIV
jgi:hypothetical protein